jgi:hypothetical protein
VAAAHGEGEIDAAIATVDALARPADDDNQPEILAHYPTARRFLPTLLRTVHFAGVPAARPLLEAVDFLTALEEAHSPDLVEAPLAAVPKAWRERVGGLGRPLDRKAYTFAVLEQVQAALRRHDLFVAPSRKWADLRVKLLQDAAWEAARPQICWALHHALDPKVELVALSLQLKDAYQRLVANLTTNPDVCIERRSGHDRLVLTPLERLDDPPSLCRLRDAVDARMPLVDLCAGRFVHPTPDLLSLRHHGTRSIGRLWHLIHTPCRAPQASARS